MSEKDIGEWSVTELKTELKKRGLATDGVKVVLAIRLKRALQASKENKEISYSNPKMSTINGGGQENVDEKNEEGKIKEELDESLDLEIEEADESQKRMDEQEGEDEFEEEEEDPEENTDHSMEEPVEDQGSMEQKEEKEEKEGSGSPQAVPHNQDDEIFLDYEEDLLEDPLDEQLSPKDKETTPSPTNDTSSSSTPGSTLFSEEAKKTSIWIRGMAPSTKASSVKQLASQYGKVVQAKIFNSRPIAGEIKNCFALLTFAERAPMEEAIEQLHRKNYQGRMLRVEKVSESHLTNSAEKIAREKEKKQAEEVKKTSPKKRQAITAPEVTPPPKTTEKKKERIQAPEKTTPKAPSKRAQIQAPPRSRSRENKETKRKPIRYNSPETREPREARSVERDSRRIIAAAPASSRTARYKISPIRASSKSGGKESLIISARVDTSGCRGGGVSIRRSVERVPTNISTSQLRRNQAPPPRATGPRASYQTEQYSREHRSEAPRRRRPSPERFVEEEEHIYEYAEPVEPRRRGQRGRDYEREPQEPLRRRRFDEEEEEKGRIMMKMLERDREVQRVQAEKEALENERQKIRFEKEKLERDRLAIELQKQKLDLERTQMLMRNGSGDREGQTRESRRRPAEDRHHSSSTPAKIHPEQRGSSRRGTENHGGGKSSSRHTTSYGIQSGIQNPIRDRGTNQDFMGGKDYSKIFENGSNNYGYQNYGSNGGYSSGYQQVWNGMDPQGIPMDTNWTSGATPSSSSSSGGNQWQGGYGNSSNNNPSRREYGYRNNNY